MPEQKISYEERLDNMAKSISAAATGYAPYKEVIGNFYVRGAAKEAVWRQAEAIREAIRYVNEYYNQIEEAKGAVDHVTDVYLLEHGYKPKSDKDAH